VTLPLFVIFISYQLISIAENCRREKIHGNEGTRDHRDGCE
jgi:hypothetical protein